MSVEVVRRERFFVKSFACELLNGVLARYEESVTEVNVVWVRK